jgi:hypothetical protein
MEPKHPAGQLCVRTALVASACLTLLAALELPSSARAATFDVNSQIDAGDPAPGDGEYSLTAQGFERAGATGTGGTSRTVSFSAIPAFELVDADSDSVLRPLADGHVLDRSELPPNLTIRANMAKAATVGSVHFMLDGAHARTENIVPYALRGDVDGDYAPATLTPGTHQLSAQSFSGPNMTGSAGPLLPLSITVVP